METLTTLSKFQYKNFSTKFSVQKLFQYNFCTELYRYQEAPFNPCFSGASQFIKPWKKRIRASSQQSLQGQSHGSTGTSIATKLRLRWIKRSSFLWGARHRSGFSKVLFSLLLSKVTKDATLSGGRGFAGQCGGVWWDGTVSSSSPFTHTAQGREGTRHRCYRCCFFTKLKPKGDIGWTENLE